MGARKGNQQSRFFEWLAGSVSSTQLSEMYQAFHELEEALDLRRYPHHLMRSLSETTDAAAVDALYSELADNRNFVRSHRAGVMLSLLRRYADYCRKHPPEADSEPWPETAASGDELIDSLKKEGIAYADNRPKGGPLWIEKSDRSSALMRRFRAKGVHFSFSATRQKWWTRDVTSAAVLCAGKADPAAMQFNQQAFRDWLCSQQLSAMNVLSIYGTARNIHALLLAEGIRAGLFGMQEPGAIRACVEAVMQRRSETQSSRLESRLWKEALDSYIRFAESRGAAAGKAHEEQTYGGTDVTGADSGAGNEPYDDSKYGESLKTGLISAESFRRWLEQNRPDEPAEPMVKAACFAEQFARSNHMHSARLMGVGPAEMQRAVNRLLASNAFLKGDAQMYREFRRAAPLLVEYARTLMPAEKDDREMWPEPDGTRKGGKELEPPLLAVLHGERLAELRAALLAKGICTLEGFKQLDLWAFMNQNGLYAIGQRQAVYASVQQAMHTASESGPDTGWKIVTLNKEYVGSSPSEALAAYCRDIALKYPLRFRNLIGQKMNGTDIVPLMRCRLHAGDAALANPEAYIDGALSSDMVRICARWISGMCHDADTPQDVVSLTPPQDEGGRQPVSGHEGGNTGTETGVNTRGPGADVPPPEPSPIQKRAEALVLAADLDGMSLEQLQEQLRYVSMVVVKQLKDASPRLVDMGDRLIHVDAFVNWDEAAGKLHDIIEQLLQKNNGYVSSAQLYEYVKVEMQMFLNDNGIADERSIFLIARHLFEKEGWQGVRYAFASGAHGGHISRGGGEALHNSFDIISRFAREHDGFFRYDDLAAYMEQVGLRTGNLRGQMQIGVKPCFFYCTGEEIISAESMRMDEEWLDQAEKALKRLFADVGDHIVLRAINPIWYEQLPTLPGHRSWTPLLLQGVLHFARYSERLGAKTICTDLNQKYDVLHAMLVTRDSEVQTFADAIAAHLVDNGIAERRFTAEALRRVLLDGGLIAGNELMGNLEKAIGRDPRFAWDAMGERVSINV